MGASPAIRHWQILMGVGDVDDDHHRMAELNAGKDFFSEVLVRLNKK